MGWMRRVDKWFGHETFVVPMNEWERVVSIIRNEPMREVYIMGPRDFGTTCQVNAVRSLHVVDDKGRPSDLTIDPAIEVGITKRSGVIRRGYFDGIHIKDDLLILPRSRFRFGMKFIPLSEVVKVEVFRGGIGFRYA